MENHQSSCTTGSGKVASGVMPLFNSKMSTIVDWSQNKPLEELRQFVATLERQEAERKAKENREMLAAMSRHVLEEAR